MDSRETARNWLQACLARGVAEFVVCGGARNAILLDELARAEESGRVRVWNHFEERGAAFFALGRCMESGRPCAVVTTSGTAVAECLPAVIEAALQARPLLVCSADRPAAYRGSGAPQTIDQPGLFGAYAPTLDAAAWAGDSPWNGRAPLHINLELEEDFPASAAPENYLPPAEFRPAWPPPDVAALSRWLRKGNHRGLVVLLGGLETEDREEVFHFCRDLAVPVVAEAASGLREALVGQALPDPDRSLAANPPGRVLRLGEVPSGRFWRNLEQQTATEVWSVCRNGLPGLARPSEVSCGEVHRVLAALGPPEPLDDALDLLRDASRRANRLEEWLEAHPDSEPALVRAVSVYASMGSGVFLGNSLPIREWNLFAQTERLLPEIRANRGANGIDGQLSTWLGWSAGQADAWGLFGDLTTLYDLAAPSLFSQVETRGRVLAVIQNNGGRIFDRLPRLADMRPRAAGWLTHPHRADLGGLARLWGMEHLVVRRAADLDAFEPGGPPLLMEIQPSESQTAAFWRVWDQRG